jgi:hypothetical protein
VGRLQPASVILPVIFRHNKNSRTQKMAIPAHHFPPLPFSTPAVALLDSLPDFEHFPWLMEEASEPDKLVEFARRYLASLADSPPSQGNFEPALSNPRLRGQKAGSAGFVRAHPRTADILRLSSECAKVGWPDEVGAQLDVRQEQLLKRASQQCNRGGVGSMDQLMVRQNAPRPFRSAQGMKFV